MRVLEHRRTAVGQQIHIVEGRRVAGHGRELVDDQPVRAVVDRRAVGFPGQPVGKRIARVAADKRLERVLDLRPPRGVVHAVRLRLVDDLDALLLQVQDARPDDARRVQRIAAAVHHEERLVAQVVGKHVADGQVFAAQHEDVAVQRQKARVRRRVLHRDVVRAGAAVRHAADGDAVLVDVVGPLHRVENRAEILELGGIPPHRVDPAGRQDVNLLRTGERADAAVTAGPVALAADAAMQLEAHLVAAVRIVGLGHVDGIEEFLAVGGVAELHDALRHGRARRDGRPSGASARRRS